MYNTNTLNSKRILWFDLLRIFATLAVILIHCCSGFQKWAPTEFNWQLCGFLNGISRWCVPVFVMISGALFLKSEQSINKLFKKNILRIITAFCFWTVVYGIFNLVVKKTGLKLALGEMIVGHYHLWFLFMIAGLYLAVPLLKKITESEKLTAYFLVLSLIFAFIIPMGIDFLSLFSESFANPLEKISDNINLKIVCGYTGYFVLGYFLSKTDFSIKQRKLIYIASALGFASTVVLSAAFSYLKNTTVDMFYGYFSLTVLLEAAGVFTLFKYGKFKFAQKHEKAVFALSKYSFGVYLVHPLVLETLSDVFGLSVKTVNPLISVPITFIIAITVSTAVSAVINHIPVLKKYIV